MRTGFQAFLICSAAAALGAQSAPPAAPSALPAFEVASIKPSLRSKQGGEGSRKQNVTTDPGRITLVNVPLRDCIRIAFEVKDYQVSGPSWLEDERFDISAKAADAVPDKELHRMLQRLLADRFKLEYHTVNKELPAYVLLVGKNGPKFHESKTEGEFSVKPTGRTSANIERAQVSQLVDLLTQVLRMPIVDETGLKGKYDITVDMTSYLPDNIEHATGPPPDLPGIVMAAVQNELGLKLESRKVPLDMIVVDRMERTPTEN
ncbi:MAG TPA: TIGR03435 family protein [Bryobacteraceae bacterium]|nr:TIGR03435 family protein [Bryobacteraceae bacterium]